MASLAFLSPRHTNGAQIYIQAKTFIYIIKNQYTILNEQMDHFKAEICDEGKLQLLEDSVSNRHIFIIKPVAQNLTMSFLQE